MKKRFLCICILAVYLLFSTLAFAADGIKYEFDEVKVVYAAEFAMTPLQVESDNWLAELAGGSDKPIKVLYGIVDLNKDGKAAASEEFIKVSGEKGSERFLVNSGGFGQVTKSFFWSAKKLVDNVVVKDFTPPVRSLTLYRMMDAHQGIGNMILYSSNDGQKAGDEFWQDDIPAVNVYQVDMDTLVQSGDPTAKID